MSKKQVLIVDDSLELGRLIRSALDTLEASLSVVIVPSAEEALLETSRKAVDLLITDVRLPGISGTELVRRMRARKKAAKVIQITALDEPGLPEQAREAGADAFFYKPLVMMDFLASVADLLGLEGPRLEAAPAHAHVENGTPSPLNLADLLADLRATLAAQAAVLVDGEGRVAARAGEFPEPEMEERILPPLMALLSAGKKAAAALDGSGGEMIFTLKGTDHDLLAAPVGKDYSVLLVMRTTHRSVRLWIASDEILTARGAIRQVLELSGMEPDEAAPPAAEGAAGTGEPQTAAAAAAEAAVVDASPEEEGPDEVAEQLATLLSETDAPKVKTDELDAYWETAAGKEEAARFSPPGALSYEQALQLGLAPAEEAEEEGADGEVAAG